MPTSDERPDVASLVTERYQLSDASQSRSAMKRQAVDVLELWLDDPETLRAFAVYMSGYDPEALLFAEVSRRGYPVHEWRTALTRNRAIKP